MLIRARNGGILVIALFALVMSTGVSAHAEATLEPEPTGDVIEVPALPSSPVPPIEPTVPEGTFDPAPTGPAPTAFPVVIPPAPVASPFVWTRPEGMDVERFLSKKGATTPRGTDGEISPDIAPAYQSVEPEAPSAEIATVPPSPDVASAVSSPDDARKGWVGLGAAAASVPAQRPPAPALPNLIFGVVALAIGLLVMKYRAPLYDGTVRRQKQWFGKGLGEFTERLASPFWIGAVGAGGVLMGVVMIGYAVWRFSTELSS